MAAIFNNIVIISNAHQATFPVYPDSLISLVPHISSSNLHLSNGGVHAHDGVVYGTYPKTDHDS